MKTKKTINLIKLTTLLMLILFQEMAYGFQDVYFKINESEEFYLSEMIDKEEITALKNEDFLTISLGWNCWTGSHLQDHALRKRSFPLDWMITSFDTIYKLLETDFRNFLDIRYMSFLPVDVGASVVKNSIHGANFVHDFHRENWRQEGEGITPLNEKGVKEYDEIVCRYKKRIARLYKVFELGIPIYLFRWDITSDQAYKLYDLLVQKFPGSNINLVCIQHINVEPNEKWNHPKIKHFSIGQNGQFVGMTPDRSRNPEWTRIYKELGLLEFRWNVRD